LILKHGIEWQNYARNTHYSLKAGPRMPDALEAIRPHSDIDWIEEEAWLRAQQWTPTPQLIFALKAQIEDEITPKLKTCKCKG
jgi:hypothetical protein